MAAIPISNGGVQVGPDNTDNYVTLSGPWNPNLNGLIEVLIQVVALTGAGIQFGVSNGDEPIAADAYQAPVGYKQTITINPNTQKLRFKCSNAADSFSLSS